MHSPEDEIIAQDAVCQGSEALLPRCVDCERKLTDKCITDDFYKPIDTREEAIPDD